MPKGQPGRKYQRAGMMSASKNSKRASLVKQGKAMWIPIRRYSVDEALERAGLV